MWNRTENKIEFVMIRHGATESNQTHRYLGRTDECLSQEGKMKLQEKKNGYPAVDHLFSSPMKRCLETADILYPDLKPVVIPEWVEIDFGAFEGKNYLELEKSEAYQRWIASNGTLPFPEGERREIFIARCREGFVHMLRQLKEIHSGGSSITIGLILHGGTIMALLNSFYGGEYFDYQAANGQGYLCTLKENPETLQLVDIRKLETDI